MATFGYVVQYPNGLNNNTQIKRSTDMIYQRGETFTINLQGDTYYPSMEMDVDIYINDVRTGRLQVVPNEVTQPSVNYIYKFNVRPYDFISNFVQSEHAKYYLINDWLNTNEELNVNVEFPNIVQVNLKYGYRYVNETGAIVTEYSVIPENDFDHYTDIPSCFSSTGFTAADFTNTGNKFDYVGGVFQMNEKFYYPNQDQELGTVIGSGLTINTVDTYRRLSPMSQFLMDNPTLPEKSQTSRFLTEAPRIQTVKDNENYILYYLAGQTGDRQVIEADFVQFTFYDSDNNNMGFFYQDLYNDYPTTYTDTLTIKKIPCGPVEIDKIYNQLGYLTNPQVCYYTVQLFSSYSYIDGTKHNTKGPVTPTSEIFYFYLCGDTQTTQRIRECCSVESTRLAFMNSRGGYDYFTFKAYRQDTKKISRQTYDSRYYSPSLNGPDHDFGRSVKQFAQDVDVEMVLESDFLTVEQGNWLEDLFLSPQVYQIKESFISPLDSQEKLYLDLNPVQILSTEVETITKKHRKLNKYRITLKGAQTFFSNKGF